MGIVRFGGRILRRRRLKFRAGPEGVRDELRYLTRQFCMAETLTLRGRRAAKLFGFLWSPSNERNSGLRVLRWVRLLEHDDALRADFQRAWVAMLTQMESVSLFAEAGLPGHHALSAEVLRRVFQRLLPSAREASDMGLLFAGIFSTQESVRRFAGQRAFIFERLVQLLWPSGHADFERRVKEDLQQALCLLATRAAGRAATEAMRQRSSTQRVEDSPFYQLIFVTESLVRARTPDEYALHLGRWSHAILRCREELDQVHLHMEDAGVSAALVYDLRSIESTLERMHLLAAVLGVEYDQTLQVAGRELLGVLIRGRLEDTRLSPLFRQNLNLLARKMVERTGHGGEHYIAHTQVEYAAMWRAAIGGGLLTVFTAAIKMRLIGRHYPEFVEGLFISLDYAASFVLMQIFGFALATKQPSMTAATLAGIIRANRGLSRYSKIAEFAADICRTQLAAAFGNVLAVCAGAVVFEQVWMHAFKTHYLPVESAQHVYHTLNPLTSGTAIFAAVTGVLLWLGGLIGGWLENFVVYHRIPEAILQHPAGHRIGVHNLQRAANWLERNVASWSTSIVLGLLLGFSPVVARFFGIALDVRHVTLNTGTLALAAASFGASSFEHRGLYYAMAGIAVTFVLNLSVSFSIASIVALRAYDIPRSEQIQILKFVVKDFFNSPLEFVVPAKPDVISITETAEGEAASEH
ncbi:Site-specific recombinase [Granulicella rosea]|uniref:Site-specific recombinase n=2 Tax=Granulicella rosea TaxID=474952 RepID=A0A239MHG2_9BACT|nr:Site-specific recombinase [Granulicella rosea]